MSRIVYITFLNLLAFMSIQCGTNHRRDVIEWLKDQNKFYNQLEECFTPFDDKMYSPIYSYSANYQANKGALSICNIDVLDAWLLKEDSSFNFYLVVKQNPQIVPLITKEFGPHSIETDIEINQVSQPTAYHWEGKYNIIVRPFHNIVGDKKYDSCILITIGNMSYKDLIRMNKERPL